MRWMGGWDIMLFLAFSLDALFLGKKEKRGLILYI
jgi:hypothetical protein